MLSFLRKRASSWIIKTVLFLIVVVFVFWGGYSYQERHRSHIIRVDDTFITWKEYNTAYEQLIELYRRQLGENLSEETLKKLDIKNQVLDLLIDRAVLMKEAQRLGIRVSSGELQESIRSIKAFQTDGNFDVRRYKLILQQNRLTPEMFEYEMIQSITLKKLEDFVMRQITVSDEDVLSYVRNLKTEKQFACVSFPWDKYESSVKPLEEDLKNHYESHKKLYESPEKRRISYVMFKSSDFIEQVATDDKEIKNYYEDHKKEYHQEKSVQARHILFKVDPKDSEEALESARKRASAVLDLARKGQNFAELAKQYSDDEGSASKGGHLGYFTRNMMIKEFSDAAFSLKEGEISDLVRSPYGFHIIKVESIRPERDLSFEEVKDTIKGKLIQDKAREMAFSAAREFVDLAMSLKDLYKAAAEKNVPFVDIQQWLSQEEALPSIPGSETLMKPIFGIQEKGISDVLEYRNDFLVVQVQAIQTARILPFEEVREKVERDYKKSKAEEIALEKSREFLKEAKSAGSIYEAAKKLGLDTSKSPFLSRIKPDISFGLWGEELERIMDLSEGTPMADKPFKAMTSYLVCQWLAVKYPNENVVKEEANRFKPMLMEQVTRYYWEGWKNGLRKQAKIDMLQKI